MGDLCRLPEDSWSSRYWDNRHTILNQLRPLEAASGASGVEVGIMLSVAVFVTSCGVSWWWWRRRVKADEEDVLVLTRGRIMRHAGRSIKMQSAPLEVFRYEIASTAHAVDCVYCLFGLS